MAESADGLSMGARDVGERERQVMDYLRHGYDTYQTAELVGYADH